MKDIKNRNHFKLKAENKKEQNTARDKYGVLLDSEEYLRKAGVASSTEYTGIVPVAMESEAEEESYEEMLNVPVGNIEKEK